MIFLIIIFAFIVSLTNAQLYVFTDDGYAFREEVKEYFVYGVGFEYWFYKCKGKCTNLTEEDRLFGSWDFSPSLEYCNFNSSPYDCNNDTSDEQDKVMSEVFIKQDNNVVHFHSKTFDQF